MILERNDIHDNKCVCMAVAGDRTHRNPVAGTFKAGRTDLGRMTGHTEVGEQSAVSFRLAASFLPTIRQQSQVAIPKPLNRRSSPT